MTVTHKEDAPEEEVEEIKEGTPEIDVQVLEFHVPKDERSQSICERNLEWKKKELKEDPAVESVDYNYVYTGSYTPRDPRSVSSGAQEDRNSGARVVNLSFGAPGEPLVLERAVNRA